MADTVPPRMTFKRSFLSTLVATIAAASVAVGIASGDASSDRLLHLEYVVTDNQITVYDIDHGNQFVRTLPLPNLGPTNGVVASPKTARLYVVLRRRRGASG